MCFGGGDGGAGKAAAEQRRREEERQRKIASETSQINSQFAGFDDNYFGDVSKAYLDYYKPQFDEQFESARRNAIFTAPGGAAGSAYGRSFEELIKERDRQEVALRQRAEQFATQQRGNVEQNRGQLISQAELAGGTGSAAERAVALSKTLATPPAYEPLADLFARYTSTVANAQQARRAGFDTPQTPILFTSPSSKAVSVVR